ncbi:hypothetical protein [Hymenobacter armeniacus]|uniref:Uncharacterized protein n=1 Tax=Hymenobacter armeniacus TaxID=2771358 RepID=A0ABR8JU83_9BACT|nr:hypothetical protein [Hymenobacter armeniacus]MBD2722660.1 hypothetical protein [Hymenobacter armeniacus]
MAPRRAAASTADLRTRFDRWQQAQLAAGRFTLPDSCASYRKRLDEHPDEDMEEQYAFPVPEEIRYSYADLNQDGTLDGLMTFTPEQCDGGNGSMWSQEAVLLLSHGSGYQLNDTLRLDQLVASAPPQDGFYHVDSIASNRIYGHYFEFGPGSGHCCPSLTQAVTFDYRLRKIIHRSANQAEPTPE